VLRIGGDRFPVKDVRAGDVRRRYDPGVAIELPIHGRGVAGNPANRFVPIAFDVDGDWLDSVPPDERPSPRTRLFDDSSRTILAHNDSPDVGFDTSINIYRGCEHGWHCSPIARL
jgi:hypothetical protein